MNERGDGAPIAHTHENGTTHDLREHLQGTGDRARAFADRFGAGEAAYLAGLWHDLGKYGEAFQKKLQAAQTSALNDEDAEAQEVASMKVDHSTAGALHACGRGEVGPLLAFAIAGHHAGLADQAALAERLQKKRWCLDEALRGGAPADLLRLKAPDLPAWVRSNADEKRTARRIEFWTRMVFSALCDADFLDTEAFMKPHVEQLRERDVPLREYAKALRGLLDEKEAGAVPSVVNDVRREVRAACVARAAEAPALFTLTVPTGGGKTLAAMSFALEHCLAHGLDRVIVAVPYTAILEQNARVYREAFKAFGEDAVVEHHSAMENNHYRNKLSAENWDAPVIVTTTVQLFESLFARRPSACRKLHRLARSVIVLDEAQALPPAMLPPILDALATLTEQYGATVVSCTATQPALKRTRFLQCGLERMSEIVPAGIDAFKRLRRVEVRWPELSAPPVTWSGLAEQLALRPDVLAIVHRRQDARDLCDALDAALGDETTVHLSALQCPAHRRQIVADIVARKKAKECVRVVATQLVEAGVDLDFAVVYRALAGLDALAQAAGRCNREGKLDGLGVLEVFLAPTDPPPGVLRDGLAVTRTMLRDEPALDLFEPTTQERYFQHFYRQLQADADPAAVQTAREQRCFELTAKRFKMIDDGWSAPVVVPWGESTKWVALARQQDAGAGLERWILRRLQPYTVSVPRSLHDRLVSSGRLERIGDTISVVPAHVAGAYDQRYGLDLERVGAGVADVDALIVG